MSKRIQLSIADPCHENWDNMSSSEKGRFCGSCQKQVIDFTNMSDSQLAAFFKNPSTGSICGRFYNDQLDRNIEIPRKRIPWVKYFFQFVLPASLFSLKASAQENARMGRRSPAIEKRKGVNDSIPGLAHVPVSGNASLLCTPSIDSDTIVRKTMGRIDHQQTKISRKEEKQPAQVLEAAKKPVSIRGKLVDNKNNPVPFATVMIKGTTTGLPADSNGLFELENILLEKQVVLEVSSVGFNTAEITINKEIDLAAELVIRLTPNINLPEVVVSASTRSYSMGAMMHSVTVSWWKRAAATEKKKLPEVKLYPNPAQRNSSFNIEFENAQDERIQLSVVNMSGVVVLTKAENPRKGFNRISVNVETSWPAGVYIVQLSDEKGQVIKKEKLIVQ